MEKRIIGRYEGQEKGSLLICIGGMHGNEPSGVEAIEEVLRLLHIEKKVNPTFLYKGAVIGVCGNLAALKAKQRFITRDLNRMLTTSEFERVKKLDPAHLVQEDRECLELLTVIEDERKKYDAPLTLILDMHTTTADGGIFTIAAEDDLSRILAKGLHAPVVLGIAEGLAGTTIDYFHHPSGGCYCIVFEAGRHDDPEGVHRTAAAIINCMRTIGAVESRDVDHRHDGLLISLSLGLPKITRLIYHYKIQPGEKFEMRPGYKNFQYVNAGDILAKNENGDVISPVEGLILMPKYQPQGNDGFFIVEVVEA
ncbi:MAG: succinylglutamate desuccinylase/aspartoacylase family protein [Saprospiraceae bacterium]|uniref:Succinylglutamate desuccinylase/aspartoacylase family protein n=1 Tax=Candidatus Opimibacter skivensis TaxID=2982028 RepID=A0A9D7STE1_9BACT|nr:succinylglutamate desuccinylase/aspartoacylase family protein [Candidatus Opimibacter skivensis]